MNDDMQFGAGFSFIEPVDKPASKGTRSADDHQQRLDDNFPWHRIRRMSRK